MDSSDSTKANISASGLGGIGRNALIRVPTTATSGIVTISGIAKSSLGTTVTGYAFINVVADFEITFAGISPILTFNGINPNDGSNLEDIIWSITPTTSSSSTATINSVTGV